MIHAVRLSLRRAFVVSGLLTSLLVPAVAQEGPVAAMFASDRTRLAALAPSFLMQELPPQGSSKAPLRVYLGAGDLERAFDTRQFRPDAAIVPTNTALQLDASDPATQQVLVRRVRQHPAILKDLEQQLAGRRAGTAAADATSGPLQVGVDSVVVRLRRRSGERPADAAFPAAACLMATDFPKGGAIDQRELFSQSRLRKGIAGCLSGLDAAGARSVVLPLLGAASSTPQESDAFFQGQRVLKECRLINAMAGLALGIHDYAAGRRGLQEIGIVQWEQEVVGMFSVPKGSTSEAAARMAYQAYADQIAQTLRRGLAGVPTTPGDVNGSCTGILDIP